MRIPFSGVLSIMSQLAFPLPPPLHSPTPPHPTSLHSRTSPSSHQHKSQRNTPRQPRPILEYDTKWPDLGVQEAACAPLVERDPELRRHDRDVLLLCGHIVAILQVDIVAVARALERTLAGGTTPYRRSRRCAPPHAASLGGSVGAAPQRGRERDVGQVDGRVRRAQHNQRYGLGLRRRA